MAFDWTTVEGYREDMSADEKLELLNNYTPAPTPVAEPEPTPAVDATPEPKAAPKATPKVESAAPKPGFISKKEFDKVSSQLADAKRQLRSRMSEEEQREADRLAEINARDEELKSLRREKTMSNHKASFLGLGLDEKLADVASTCLTDGDSDGLFDALKKYQINYEKSLRAKILAETPKPPASDPNTEEAKKQDLAKLREYFGLAPN